MPVGGQAYTPPTMSARITSAPRARRIRAERRRALGVGAMGGVAGAVWLLYTTTSMRMNGFQRG